MRIKRYVAGLLSAVFLVCTLGSCDMFTPQFMEYDVSGYLKALLDSSYKGEHDDFINFTQSSVSEAEENNQLTVENGAVYFCNAFGIYASDEQMLEIQEFIRTAYAQVDYTVQDEVATDEGYTVEIDIKPLTTFRELTEDYEQAKNAVEYGTMNSSSSAEDSEVSEEENADQEEDTVTGEGESEEVSDSSGSGSKVIDSNELFVDEVIRVSQTALAGTPKYDQTTTITMNIKLDEDGILYMDLTQLEQIDVTVILFATA